jgi:galactokinase
MEGGGMDQAISFLAQHGTAKLIEFNPLTTFDVSLPAGYAVNRICLLYIASKLLMHLSVPRLSFVIV